MNPDVDLHSLRATKARFARTFGDATYRILMSGSVGFALLAVVLFMEHDHVAYAGVALMLLCFSIAWWYRQDLKKIPAEGASLTGRLSSTVLANLDPNAEITPQSMWLAITTNWQTNFIFNHLMLPTAHTENYLSTQPADMAIVWATVDHYANITNTQSIEPGFIAAAIIRNAPQLQPVFGHIKITSQDIEDIVCWLGRVLEMQALEHPFFGGIGRDWASGFTPMLERFGINISLSIEHSGAHFGALTDSPGVAAIQNSFQQGARAIVLTGPDGIGKTSHVYALAQLLLEGSAAPSLAYHQIVELNASTIISSAQHPGELEQIVLTLLHEASVAGHILLFLDDAQLFFNSGPGSFDATQILLPVIQSGTVPIILAMEPSDLQRLKAQNSAFANLLSPVVLTERPQEEVMNILEDTALSLEHSHHVFVSYEAIKEAYRLSGRYEQDVAYPGKAINLMNQSLTHAENGNVITAASVQQAIEQTRGVKVGSAGQAEANQLLHLEDLIHERMINQVRAVQVVSAALRRARAGVSNPKRPIGSFLFLGPTGVGKTELAKAIAATYFGSESNMIRLDMSEYQQPEDVKRLLSDGKDESMSLLLAVRQQPFTVVLLDEIEKAHPNILNLLLQLLDEGNLTDNTGRQVSFRDTIIIATSNAGAQTIRERVEQGEALESFEKEFTDQLISSGQFKPELLNRFDEIVLFRPLQPEELAQVVSLMMNDINKTLSNQNISVALTPAAIQKIVAEGNDPRLGARPMRRMLQRAVEDGIAGRILRGETRPGDHVVLDLQDLSV